MALLGVERLLGFKGEILSFVCTCSAVLLASEVGPVGIHLGTFQGKCCNAARRITLFDAPALQVTL